MLLIYTKANTNRFSYITEVLFTSVWLVKYRITLHQDEFLAFDGLKINYSDERISPDEIWIQPHSLLFEKGISPQQTDTFEWQGYQAFFKTGGDMPFDIFAASFYLITRYEEYLPHQKDEYGRYAHTNSLAFKQGFLHLPLVNLWLKEMFQVLGFKFQGSGLPSHHSPFTFPDSRFPIDDSRFTFHVSRFTFPDSRLTIPDSRFPIHVSRFTYTPTYDIDIAYAYNGKGIVRNIGSFCKDLLTGKWKMVAERIKFYSGMGNDPFDTYQWLHGLHEKYQLTPIYFFLLAAKHRLYDKNIPPQSKVMKRLVQQHAQKYPVGIHPSWQSGDDEQLLNKEIITLSCITDNPIQKSRQHYIRMEMPSTYRLLIAKGITEEYSMGYGSINGFRASVASPFYWFDVEYDIKTNLLIHPYCYMEANSFFEQHYTAEQAALELQQYHDVVKAVGGELITIFHNHFVTEQPQWVAWRNMYADFLEKNFS